VISAWEHTLGRTLRELRQEKGFTLTALGRITDLSPSFLSQLERGLTSASLNSLSVLAEALGTSAAALLSGAQQTTAESVSFMKADQAPQIPDLAGTGFILVQGRRALQPLLLVGGPREFSENHVVHDGDEFIYVMAGRVQFDLVGEGLFDLEVGDSLCYGGGIKHRWRQVGGKTCRFVAVLSDPRGPNRPTLLN
jgi:transcriptional regulator with XRE-family HTH domain